MKNKKTLNNICNGFFYGFDVIPGEGKVNPYSGHNNRVFSVMIKQGLEFKLKDFLKEIPMAWRVSVYVEFDKNNGDVLVMERVLYFHGVMAEKDVGDRLSDVVTECEDEEGVNEADRVRIKCECLGDKTVIELED